MNIASLLSTATLAVTEAETILPAVDYFVRQAETVETATPATGAQKLAAVKLALQAFIANNFPHLQATFDAIWTSMTGVINGLVALYNALGVFKKSPTPAPAPKPAASQEPVPA